MGNKPRIVWKPNIKQLILDKSAKEGRLIEQQEVAAAIGVEQNTISRWARGMELRQLEAELVWKLSNYFEVDFRDFLELGPEDTTEEKKSLRHHSTAETTAATMIA